MEPKLGLIGPKADPRGRTLKLKDFLKPDLAYPAACDLTMGLTPDTDDLGNKEVGCCAVAGPGHFVRWEDQFVQRPERVQADDVLREYSALTGYVPGDASTDTGTYAIDVMKRWRNVSLFGSQIEAYALVDTYNADEIAKATFLLGGVFLCFSLPRKVKSGDIFSATVWDVADDDGGVAGGHLVWRYGDPVNSWGLPILVMPAFIARYAYEAWAVVSAESVQPWGRAFSGLDIVGLRAALAAVTV